MFDLEVMRLASVLADFTDAQRDSMRAAREEQEYEPSQLEGLDPHTDDQVAAMISPEARDLVIGFEVSDKRTYERKYQRPEWPGGASGITIGIGYDIGYGSANAISSHWKGLLSEPDIALLCSGAGLKGKAAQAELSRFKSIVVPYDVALEVYRRTTMPGYGRRVLGAFPNTADLAGHAFGALFSLVYNRGESLKGTNREEMKRISELTAARQFDEVPGQIRAMKHIWEGRGLPGLIQRRELEARLFERGLQVMGSTVATASVGATAAQQPGGARLESLNPTVSDLAARDGDGQFERDAPVLESGLDEAVWSEVGWVKDEQSPDYSHLADRPPPGSTFEFGPAELELLIAANDFNPDRTFGRIIFALRGCELVTSLEKPAGMTKQEDRAALTLRDIRPDHHKRRCVIGVYNTVTQRLSAYTSSTVPCRRAVATYHANKTLGNMMVTGRYRFEIGWHHASEPAKRIPGCLIENGRQKAVLRSINNLVYDTADVWENHKLHGDNLHPATRDRSADFS